MRRTSPRSRPAPPRRRLAALLLCGGLVAQTGCATAKPARAPQAAFAALGPGVYRGGTGEPLDPAALDALLLAARVVLVGETHDDLEDHRVQDEVHARLVAVHELRAATEGGTARLAVGLEMVQRPFQPALDAFTAGAIDEPTMLDQVEWSERWGYDPVLLRPIWERARALGHPLVALNVRRELTKRVASVGLAGLSPEERTDVVELDLDSPAYRAWLKGIFEEHGAPGEGAPFERFVEAQILWDETMAATAVAFLAERPDVAAMLVLAGRGHVERGHGIPDRIRRRRPEWAGDAVVTVIPARPGARAGQAIAERWGDVVWISGAPAGPG